jgi:hypothetical protein
MIEQSEKALPPHNNRGQVEGDKINNHRRSVLASLLIALSLVLFWPNASLADSAESVKISHNPAKSEDIPPIGNPMNVDLELLNTTDVDANVRLVGSKDGRFIDISFPRGALNERDHPLFQIQIPSPVAAMSYQFIVKPSGGKSFSTSERYVVKRSCMQNFKVAVPENEPNSAFRREISTMISQANILERDTASLEDSLKILEELKTTAGSN